HDHIERLIGGVHGVGSRRSCRSWEDIYFTAHFDEVRGMPPTGSFGVKGMDSPAFERCDSPFDETALVLMVGMNGNLYIHVIRDREAAIDGSRSCTPVFMKLQAARSGLDLLNESRPQACIAFAEEAKIHGKGIGSLEHPRNVPWSWSASRGSRSNRWSCPTTHQCR